MRRRILGPILSVAILLFAMASVMADTHAGETIDWQVISSGSADCSSTNYQIKGTVAQTATGSSSSTSYTANHGFWQDFGFSGEPCCGIYFDGLTGNNNCSADGKLTLSDVTTLIDHIYINKPPLCCHANGNVNGSADCKLTLSDITSLIDTIYINKLPPAACMLACEQ